MTFLVVDDDIIIRQTLIAMLRQYCEHHALECTIKEAEDGMQAIEIARSTWCEIIFMDINMPQMNGIEATKVIKSFLPRSMLIAISSIDDDNKRNELLQIGAEDYIAKPINASSFKSRIANYLSILQYRNSIHEQSSVTNLFTSKIYSYKFSFTITCDEELAQFWEAILIRYEMQRHIINLNDIVRTLFRLGSLLLRHKYRFSIIIEEDRDDFYFSVTNMILLKHIDIDALILKSFPDAIFIHSNGILSFLLTKDTPVVGAVFTKTAVATVDLVPARAIESTVAPIVDTASITNDPEKSIVFEFLNEDDLEDFEDKLYKLHQITLSMSSRQLTIDDSTNICTYFDAIASSISISNETFRLSEALHRLSNVMRTYQDEFVSKSEELATFSLSFINDLLQWKDMIFYTGAPSIHFMDDSIISNVEMIVSVLRPPEIDTSNLDDIFEF